MCPISTNFTRRLDIPGRNNVRGVTKLGSKIYVLCGVYYCAPNVILVFEDRNLFCLQNEIEIKQIISLDDIGSNENENCLYVCDILKQCVWKVIRGIRGDQYEIIKWLITDYNYAIHTS